MLTVITLGGPFPHQIDDPHLDLTGEGHRTVFGLTILCIALQHGHAHLPAVTHPDITIHKRFGDEGEVDVGILGWGSTFGEVLEAMFLAQAEGIRCSAMKVVLLSPLPVQPVKAFFSDCREVLIPELNYEGQFANLVGSAISQPFTRLNQVPGVPMQVSDILDEIRRLAKQMKPAA